MTCHSY